MFAHKGTSRILLTGVDFSTADYPNKMVAPTMFAHKGTSRILLTGVDFSAGAEFSRLGDISSIERVALAGPHAPNLNLSCPDGGGVAACVVVLLHTPTSNLAMVSPEC